MRNVFICSPHFRTGSSFQQRSYISDPGGDFPSEQDVGKKKGSVSLCKLKCGTLEKGAEKTLPPTSLGPPGVGADLVA